MDFIILGLFYWIFDAFFPDEGRSNREEADLAAGFFFGTADWENDQKSNPVNSDYDDGPDW